MSVEDTIYILIIVSLKGRRVQIFGNNISKSIFYSGKNLEQIEVKECLLPFSTESLAVQFAIKKYKDSHTQNFNFACCFVWM